MSVYISNGKALKMMCWRGTERCRDRTAETERETREKQKEGERGRGREKMIEMGWKEILTLRLSSECQVIYIVILSNRFCERVKRVRFPKGNFFALCIHHWSVSTTATSDWSSSATAAVVTDVVVVTAAATSVAVAAVIPLFELPSLCIRMCISEIFSFSFFFFFFCFFCRYWSFSSSSHMWCIY